MLFIDHLLCDIFQTPPRFPAQQTELSMCLLFGNSIKGLKKLLGFGDEPPLLDFVFQFRQNLFEDTPSLRSTQHALQAARALE